MLQTHVRVEYLLKVQVIAIKLKYKKFIYMVSNSALQQTFKKLLLSECRCSIIEEY